MVAAADNMLTTPVVLEPRYFARVDLEVDVVVEYDEARHRGRSVNISEGGIAVRAASGPAKESSVGVTFRVPGEDAPIHAVGRVVRSVTLSDGMAEFAISFELGDVDAAVVRRVVAEHGDVAWEPSDAAIPREVALRFIPLIRRIARGFARRLPPDVAVDDLVGSAFVALVETYRQHAGTSTEELERIALPRVRYAMLDELREGDPLSRRMRRKATAIGKARSRLEGSLSRTPTRAELASETGMTEAAVAEAERVASSGASSAHASVHELELADHEEEGPDEAASRAQSLERLRTALDALPPRHKKILELYYGEDLTLRQIGNLLGVTEARISQLVSDAVKKLRHTMPLT